MRTYNVESQKRTAKGLNFKEDDRALLSRSHYSTGYVHPPNIVKKLQMARQNVVFVSNGLLIFAEVGIHTFSPVMLSLFTMVMLILLG